MYEREKEKVKQAPQSNSPLPGNARTMVPYLRHSVRTMELYIRRDSRNRSGQCILEGVHRSSGGTTCSRSQACQGDDEGGSRQAQSTPD